MRGIMMALLVTMSLYTNVDSNCDKTGYILLGDSRTVGLESAVELEDNMFVVAEVGKGYHWMVNTGLQEVYDIVEDNAEYTDWVIISNLGVNDLGNKDKYIDKYSELSENFDLFIVSVNPCSKSYKGLNSSISSFNDVMQSLDYVTYIDTCSKLLESGFTTGDGLHYGKSTYQEIYETIIDNLKGEYDVKP